jgi:hypothetical protein
MIAGTFIWAFTSFLFFKIAFDAVYYSWDYAPSDSALTIIAAFIIGIVTAIWINISAVVYGFAYRRRGIIAGVSLVTPLEILKYTSISLLFCSAAYVLIVRLIIFGFSKQLSSHLGIFSKCYGCSDNFFYGVTDNFIEFVGLTIIPMLLHYLLNSYGIWNRSMLGTGRKLAPEKPFGDPLSLIEEAGPVEPAAADAPAKSRPDESNELRARSSALRQALKAMEDRAAHKADGTKA